MACKGRAKKGGAKKSTAKRGSDQKRGGCKGRKKG